MPSPRPRQSRRSALPTPLPSATVAAPAVGWAARAAAVSLHSSDCQLYTIRLFLNWPLAPGRLPVRSSEIMHAGLLLLAISLHAADLDRRLAAVVQPAP